jgi:ankyrin repeat protein
VKSLSFDESEQRLAEILNPNQRTFGWLWEDDIGLGRWVEDDGGIFWVTGKPGSGKSTLMKEINSQLQNIFPKDAMIIPFFFNNQGTPLQKSVTGMLRHFSAEILRGASEVPDAVLRACQKKAISCANDEIKWEFNELKKILLALLQSGHPFMYLVFLVDALDECDDASIMGLFTLFKELIERCPKGAIKICVSSRQMPLSLEVGGKYPGLCLQDKTLQDISNYAEDKLIDLDLEEEHDLLEEMKSEIIKKADGIFLWVELIMKVLQHAIEAGDTYSSYKKLLTQLPSKLTELYHQILMKVDAKFREERNKLFGIILCSRRPMSVAEIRLAMALGSDIIFESHQHFKKSRKVVQDDITMIKIIKSRCGGLLETRKKNDLNIVQFIHQSVKDFLVDENEKPNSEIFGDSRLFMLGHTILSKACIRYCILPELESLPESLRYLVGPDLEREMEKIGHRYPFIDYAINFWPEHCGDAERLGVAQTNEITRFEGPGARAFDTWLELYNQYTVVGKLADNTSLLSLAVMFDLKDLARQQISQGIDVNTPVRNFGTYLHVAAMAGLTDMINLLIENGATVNAVGGRFHTALQAAAYSGNKESVAALLDAGADISIRGGRHPDALSAAAFEGHEDIVDLLLEKLDQVTDVGGYANEALRAATLTGRNTVVRTLLSRGVDVMAWDEDGVNILTWAIVSSSLSTVTEFIESGMDTATRIFPGFTLLHWVSLNGRAESVNLLLEKSADVNARDFNGSTPLHWAASNQRNEVLEILISHGADPSLPNNHGITPLHFAAGQAGISQVQSLLDGGADLSDLDAMNFSVVHYAALNSSDEVLDSLIDSGLNITSQDFLGRRPVHIAAEFGQLASLKLLSRVDMIPELRDLDSRTILHAAARNSSEHVLEHCLETGSNVASVDGVGMTAIHHVFAPQGELPRLAYLPNFIMEVGQEVQEYKKQSRPKGRRRKRGVDPLALKELSEDDKSALVATAKIQLLLQYGAAINAQDENGNTALHLAGSKGNISAIKLLLSKNANRHLRDFRGFLPEDTARTDEARDLILS